MLIMFNQQNRKLCRTRLSFGNSRILGELRDTDGNVNSGARNIADTFARYFESVYRSPRSVPSEDLARVADSSLVHIDTVCEDDLISAAKKLKNKNTAGPDGIPSFVVKDCIRVLAVPLMHIFNLSLRTGVYPSIWKLSKIIPVLKRGDKSDVTNYRPISILSNFSKIFEIILHRRIFPEIKNKIICEQHGFMPHRSSLTNLAVFSQTLVEILDQSGQLDVIYTDFSRAFDSVDHRRLIMKLKYIYGFSDSLLGLITSYLSNRRQYVRVENSNSFMFLASSGVPQGSNLGPLLFILFINDLLDEIKVLGLLFADDFKFYLKIISILNCATLQLAIDQLSRWCNLNNLDLNINKCQVMSYTRKKNVIMYPYNIGGKELARATQIRDLGVIFDEKCSFVPHIENLISSAFRVYVFIVRNSVYFASTKTLLSLFNSLIRSRLEYASLIWRPIYRCHGDQLENVQRKCCKFLVWREDSVYPPIGCNHRRLLERFNGQTLENRRAVLALKTISIC